MTQRQDLILEHLQYARGIAFRVCWAKGYFNILFDDCQSVAAEALIKAVDNYDENSGASLKTWIIAKVRFAVLDFIRKETHSRRNGGVPIMVDIAEHSNSLELATDGTEQVVCNKDMIYKTLSFVHRSKKMRRRSGEIEDLLAYLSDGYLMREIASWRGCSEANVSMMISGLKKQVKNFEKDLIGRF